jgi:heme ABC exporter ATP-binding subunit CcmA
MISVKGVSKSFGATRALKDIDFEIAGGEAVLIEGPNGSGKTTLLKTIAGLLRPSSGSVEIDGRSPVEARRMIGYLAHEPHLYPHLTLLENLGFFADLYDVTRDAPAAWLEKVRLVHRADALTGTLSRGELQRAAIARVLLHDPDVVLADEPFAGLDEATAASIPELIRREGRTLLLATHDLEKAWLLAERVATLDNGKLIDWRRH